MLNREDKWYIDVALEMESKGYKRLTVPEAIFYNIFGPAEFAKADKLAFRYAVAFVTLTGINPNESDFELAHLSCRNRLSKDLIEVIDKEGFCLEDSVVPDIKEREIYEDVRNQIVIGGVLKH